MVLANNIRYLRKKRGWSQDYLAERLGYKSYTTIQKWESGVSEPPLKKAHAIADLFGVDINDLTGSNIEDAETKLPSDAIPYAPTGMVPVLGRIPAGMPVLAEEHIEGYEPVDVPDPENYYWLRVEGDSMINAGIQSGDLVLMRAQTYAENGQIVACRVNGDEATLKRFREQGDSIILLPENPAYEPRIVSKKDFADGYAGIVGVAIEIKRKL